jgi:hypothetical protein
MIQNDDDAFRGTAELLIFTIHQQVIGRNRGFTNGAVAAATSMLVAYLTSTRIEALEATLT